MKQVKDLKKFFATHPLTKNNQLRAWSRFAVWQIRSRLQDEVIVNWVNGKQLCVKRSMTGATGNIYSGLHEFVDMAFLLHFLRKDELFFDVGANVGTYTVLAAGVCQSNVWAFEPDPHTFAHLKRNIELNSIEDKVKLLEIALGDSVGQVAFTVGLDTINHVTAAGVEKTRSVTISKLDSLLSGLCPTMMKIDIEGHEPAMMNGAVTTLQDHRLRAIVIETLTPEISSLFDQYDFKRVYYNPFNRELSRSYRSIDSTNAIYVRNFEQVSARLRTAPAIEVFNMKI